MLLFVWESLGEQDTGAVGLSVTVAFFLTVSIARDKKEGSSKTLVLKAEKGGRLGRSSSQRGRTTPCEWPTVEAAAAVGVATTYSSMRVHNIGRKFANTRDSSCIYNGLIAVPCSSSCLCVGKDGPSWVANVVNKKARQVACTLLDSMDILVFLQAQRQLATRRYREG